MGSEALAERQVLGLARRAKAGVLAREPNLKAPAFAGAFKFCSFPGSDRGPKGCGETVPAVGGEQRYLVVHSGLSVRRGLAPS